MKRLLTPLVLFLLLAGFPAGCNNPAKLIAVGLKLEVSSLKRAADGTLRATWHIENSNVVAYLVSRISEKIYLDGILLGAVDEGEPMAVPATARAGRTSVVSGGNAESVQAVTAAAARGTGAYRIESTIVFRLYDDEVQRSNLANTGTVPVTAK